MKNYKTPVMSLFYTESKDVITVSGFEAVGSEKDIHRVSIEDALNNSVNG